MPRLLGLVQGVVGLLYQSVWVDGRILRKAADAGAKIAGDEMTFFLQPLHGKLSQCVQRVLKIFGLMEQDKEFVSGGAGQKPPGAERALPALRQRGKKTVGSRCPDLLIDPLEMVQIEGDDDQRMLALHALTQFADETVEVVQPGQSVVKGEEVQVGTITGCLLFQSVQKPLVMESLQFGFGLAAQGLFSQKMEGGRG